MQVKQNYPIACSKKDGKFQRYTYIWLKTKNLKDAISVRDLGQQYKIGVRVQHCKIVANDGEQDKYAQQKWITIYGPETEITHIVCSPSKNCAQKFRILLRIDCVAIKW